MWLSILAGVLFIGIGLLLSLKPKLIWQLTEQWKSYYADEPSDLYIKSTRFGGILFTLLGAAMIILPIFL